jgi:exonuclease SbcC
VRLHRLSMTAIGPFREQVDIDFSRLGASGLFLLEGPTGSGKSTVIDAISFALYGRVAQVSATVERLRSHHADPSTEPVVELVFETQNGIYRVRRTPTFDRPKRKGSGLTRVQGTIKIWRITSPDDLDGGEPLSTRVAEADDEILRAIGLNHDQFVQTMVLPQGEFANFLRSKTDDKRALLQKLFGTEVVARTQERLIEGRRRAEALRSDAAKTIGTAVHSFAGAAGADPGPAQDLEGQATNGCHDQLSALVTQILAELRSDATAAANRSALATAARNHAQQELAIAHDLRRRRDKRAALLELQRALLEQQPSIDLARARLAAAERATTVTPVANALAVAIERSDSAQDADASARASLDERLAAAAESALREAAAAARTTIGQLAEALRRESELVNLTSEHQHAASKSNQLGAEIAATRADLAALPAQIQSCTEARRLAFTVAVRETSIVAEADRAAERLAAAERANEAAAVATRDELITQTALSAYEQQELRLGALRLSWRASVAGELGQALVVGDPCVVCGSVEHPRPAAPGADHVSQDDLDSAEHELRRLRRSAEAARAELVQKRNELAELRVAADQLNPDQARSKLDELSQALDDARAAAVECDRLNDELAILDQRGTELWQQLQATEVNQGGLVEKVAALAGRIEADTKLIEHARAGLPSVAARVQALTEEANLIETAAQAAAAVTSALAHALECGQLFDTALADAAFDDQQAWHAARLTATEIGTLRSHLKAFDDDWTTVQRTLTDAELTDPALERPIPELPPLQEAVAIAEAAESAAAAAHGSAAAKLAASRKQSKILAAAMALGGRVLAETAPAIRLGHLAAGTGDNQLRMELTAYVLTRRFGDIVSAANSQLRRISGGRYELEHTDSKTGNARSGLGLLVLDLHTGRTRDPGTLSGGETFYVSLSLALGLADVVRAESGGVDLGTLFIDEGFGSLDADMLDEVLSVLDSLRAGGRAVGVVSHVSEMKARIADRIVIHPNPDGTARLRVVA